MGLGQVRVLECNRFCSDLHFIHTPLLATSSVILLAFSLSDWVGVRFLLSPRVCVCDGACRRDSERQLQPVPGGDLWDWVR